VKDFAFVTFLWTDPNYKDKDIIEFKVEHVEKLGRALRKHCTLDFEYVLITDQDPSLFTEPDRVIPLWDDWREMGGCYVRLKAFEKEVGESIAPRFMWLDLDIVITGNIDHLVDHEHEFWSWVDVNPPTPYCGSLIGMKAGTRSKVWRNFQGIRSRKLASKYIGTDQAWIGTVLGLGEKTFGREDGIYSYKKHIRGLGHLPDNCCMVVFHGNVDPSICKDRWIKDHWV
jgi:hypothetical protein